MKKNILAGLVFLLCTFASFAQRQVPAKVAVSSLSEKTNGKVYIDPASLLAQRKHFQSSPNSAATATPQSRWLSWAATNDSANGNLGYWGDATNGANSFLLFPDSGIIYGTATGGTVIYPGIHYAATMCDPTAPEYNWLASYSDYSLDSIAIDYAYLRNTASTIVDTLVIQTIKHDDALRYDLGTAPNDTIYQDIEYDSLNNKVRPAQIWNTYKIPLTEADSTSNFRYIGIATPQPLARNNRIGVVFYFKPGYTYSIADSIDQKNSFYVLSQEENGLNSYPMYYDTVYLNCSYILNKEVRYNISTNGWNGFFLPTWAFLQGYSFENHDVQFKFTQLNTGVKEPGNNGVVLSQNIPNPFKTKTNTSISYVLNNTGPVSVVVRDLIGRTMTTLDEGIQSPGTHAVSLDAKNLSPGIYFYTLKTGNTELTKKMLVID